MPTQPAANAARGTYPRRIAPRLNEKYKNNIFLKPKRLIFRLAREMGGAGALHFLVEHFSFFGFEGQYWMIIVLVIVAGFVLLALGTRRRN